MSLLEDMLRRASRKVEKGSDDFCGTPTTAKETRKLARTVLLGKGQGLDCLFDRELDEMMDRLDERGSDCLP